MTELLLLNRNRSYVPVTIHEETRQNLLTLVSIEPFRGGNGPFGLQNHWFTALKSASCSHLPPFLALTHRNNHNVPTTVVKLRTEYRQ
jgi:hypothetical protein